MLAIHVFAALLVHRLAFAYYGDISVGAPLALCNTTTSNANGTGVVSFDPEFWTAQNPDGGFASEAEYNISDPSWLTTVHESGGSYQTTYWFSPAGQHYWNDTATLFDACAFFVSPKLPINTLELSQHDPGDCSVMLSAGCRRALTDAAAASAQKYISYASPPPNSNLSAGVLPWLCSQIVNDLTQVHENNALYSVYDRCGRELDYDSVTAHPNPQIVQLTGYNRSQAANPYDVQSLQYSCPIIDTDGTKYYGTYGFSYGSYDQQMLVATPILSVYFALANEDVLPRSQLNQYSSSQLTCPRVTHVALDSRTPTYLAAGTAYSSSVTPPPRISPTPYAGIPVADLAGIVVGCVVFLVLVGLLVARWRWRKTKRRRATEKRKLDAKIDEVNHTELERGDKYELSAVDRKPEIDGVNILEAEGNPPPELAAPRAESTHGAAELDGTSRWSFNSSRASLSSYNTAGS